MSRLSARPALLALAGTGIGICAPSAVAVATPAASATPTLVNNFNDANSVTHSVVGPPLAFFNYAMDCTAAAQCLNGIDMAATPAFVPSRSGHGDALSIGPGSYHSGSREHNVVLRDIGSVINPERGTISIWFQQNKPSVAYQNGVYRLFGGPWGLTGQIALYVAGSRLHFELAAGGTDVVVNSIADQQPGVKIGKSTEWRRIVAVWDRSGISGSADTMRLYISGKLVATTTTATWGTTFGTDETADIGGGNDGAIAGAFAVDELRTYATAVPPA